MAELLHQPFSSFSFNGMKLESRRVGDVRKVASFKPLQCVLNEKDNRRIVVVKNGKDSLDMCRVVNGMWQTSGGWGKIDRDKAVDAMLKYADAGLTTFDMAEICNELMKKQLVFQYCFYVLQSSRLMLRLRNKLLFNWIESAVTSLLMNWIKEMFCRYTCIVALYIADIGSIIFNICMQELGPSLFQFF